VGAAAVGSSSSAGSLEGRRSSTDACRWDVGLADPDALARSSALEEAALEGAIIVDYRRVVIATLRARCSMSSWEPGGSLAARMQLESTISLQSSDIDCNRCLSSPTVVGLAMTLVEAGHPWIAAKRWTAQLGTLECRWPWW
jgi:hypothetical protein